MNEILFIDKPSHMTSFDVCYQLRKVLHTKQIGHTGTLDPLATGVMVILSGKNCKANQFLVSATKEYVTTVLVGVRTDTFDIEGKILEERECRLPAEEKIREVLDSFLGESLQTPPMTSAIKVKGKKLVDYQRQNIEVEIPKRTINVFEMELMESSSDRFTFRSKVSSGTYIRSLTQDICEKLGCIGSVEALRRTKVDEIDVKDCDDFEDVLKGNFHNHSLLECLKEIYPVVDVDDPKDVMNGKVLQIEGDSPCILLTYKDEVLAVYRKKNDGYHCVRGLF